MGTFLYGSRRAWQAFLPLYIARVRELIVSSSSGLKMLCLDQDIFEDLAARPSVASASASVHSAAPSPTGSPPGVHHLYEEYTTSDGAGWGWADARAATVECAYGETNLLNECVRDPKLS